MFWWMYATADQVFEKLLMWRPRSDNFYEWIEEEHGMSEQIWAIQEDLTDNPWYGEKGQ